MEKTFPDSHPLLLFAGYSVEVSKKHKVFSSICSEIYHNWVKFTLAYPATLRIMPLETQYLSPFQENPSSISPPCWRPWRALMMPLRRQWIRPQPLETLDPSSNNVAQGHHLLNRFALLTSLVLLVFTKSLVIHGIPVKCFCFHIQVLC